VEARECSALSIASLEGTHTTNSFAKLVVTGGLWQSGVDRTLGAVPGAPLPDAITLDGGGLRPNAGFTMNSARGITLGTNGGRITGSSLTVPGVITGPGSLTREGANTLTLTNAGTRR
jgi:fibronectin-binding autotransporter adhesin